MWWMMATALAGGDPDLALDVEWKGARSLLHVRPAAGLHVAEDAYADLALTAGDAKQTLSLPGRDAARGFGLGDLRGQAVEGTLAVSLCNDDNTLCRRVEVGFTGVIPQAGRGRATLVVAPATPEAAPAWKADAQAAAAAAFAQAKADGSLVLLDFTAVWCPPCNLMAAEVLHDPAALEGFALAQLDADDASSWTMKDRYAVTGYPTLVATDADGNEVGRMLGYTGAEAMRAWLGEVRGGDLRQALAAGPDAVEPAKAALIAWRLASSETGDPQPWLDRAASAADVPELRLARVVHAPTPEDARWLAKHAPTRALDWVPSAMGLAETADGKAALREALQAGAGIPGPAEGDRLAMLAELAETDAEKRILYAAAAKAVKDGFSGDPGLDRAWYTTYAAYLTGAGQLDAAIAFLDEAAVAFPDEPTFLLSAASKLLDAERWAEALDRADRALVVAWGDNRIRVATARAKALVGLGRQDEARAFAEQVLAEIPAPPEGVKVRTTRYRDLLAEAVASP